MTDVLPQRWRIPGAVYLSHGAVAPPAPATLPHTASLHIVQPTLHDAEELLAFEIENRAYFESWINPRDPAFYSLDGVREAIGAAMRETLDDISHQYLVKMDGSIVGRVNLKDVLRPYFNKVELGYRMGERHAGKGYASQAVAMVLREAFERHRFARVEATVREVNGGSMRVLARNGFQVFGRSERSVQFNGEWFDLLHLRREGGR